MPKWAHEWVIFETDNWHLKPDAPEDIQREFAEWMKAIDRSNEPDIDR